MGGLIKKMEKKWKVILFMLGLTVLFFVLQYDFLEDNTWKPWNLPLSGKVILIDPGHGGPDGGAGDKNALEKDIALNVSLKIKDYLEEQGALVMMTREEDKDLAKKSTSGYSKRKTEDLKKRLNIINESDADLFISVHLNSIPSPRWSGAQTFYAPHYKENARAAKFIQDEFKKNLKNTIREAKPINNVYIIKHAKRPGVLVEVGFLSNPAERANLKKSSYQDMLAESIYLGVLRYFSHEKEIKIVY